MPPSPFWWGYVILVLFGEPTFGGFWSFWVRLSDVWNPPPTQTTTLHVLPTLKLHLAWWKTFKDNVEKKWYSYMKSRKKRIKKFLVYFWSFSWVYFQSCLWLFTLCVCEIIIQGITIHCSYMFNGERGINFNYLHISLAFVLETLTIWKISLHQQSLKSMEFNLHRTLSTKR